TSRLLARSMARGVNWTSGGAVMLSSLDRAPHRGGRGHGAKLLDLLTGEIDHVIHLSLRVAASQTETKRSVREIARDAEREDDMRGLGARRGASRSRRYRDVAQRHEERLAVHARERDIEIAGEPVHEAPVHLDLVDARKDSLAEPLAQAEETRAFFSHLARRDLAGGTEAHDAGHVQGSRAKATLVSAAIHLRLEANARRSRAYVEGAHALGTVDLVRGDGEEIHARATDVDRQLAERLGGVDGEEHAALVADLPDALD